MYLLQLENGMMISKRIDLHQNDRDNDGLILKKEKHLGRIDFQSSRCGVLHFG
jgi:hypothetical protein